MTVRGREGYVVDRRILFESLCVGAARGLLTQLSDRGFLTSISGHGIAHLFLC